MKKVKVFGVFFIIVLCMFLTSCSFGGKEDDKDNNKEDNKEDNISHVHQYNNGLCSCGATIDVIYKVVFLDYNGTILKEQKVAKGEAAIAPNNPSREGYNFVGWSSNYSQINNDLAIVAQYSIIESAPHQHNYVNGVCSCGDVEVAKYNVTFIDYNGSVLKEETVEKNQSVAAPANPSRTGYIFTGWSNEFENITSDLVIVALYNIDVPEGHEHIYIKGVCSCGDTLNEYFTVVFKDYNGKVLKEELVLNFTTANPPTVPIRDGYLFIGWSNSFSSVEHDLEVITQYKENNIVDHEHDLIETHYNPTCIESSYNLFACNSCDYQYKSTSGFKYSHYIENNVCVNCNSIVDENGFVLYFDEETNGYSIVGYTGDEIIYELPSSHNSIPITKIGDCAFSDPTEFYKEIKLPKDLLIIGNYAFEYANFVSIELPDTVIAIEESAFFSSEIANIKLSNSLQTIQDFAFCECDNLNSIILPDSLISIGEAAFADCGALSSVHIGKNLQKMGIEAFAYNDSMLNITVDEENNYFTVEDGMLYSKDKSILYYYFSSKLQEALVIPEFVKIIREDSLYYSSEEIIYLPKDLIELSFNANRNVDLYFNGSLKEWFNVKVDRLSLYGGNLYLKNNDDEYQNFAEIKELVIPEGITKINSKSIPNDNIIEKIVIPNTVVEIENYAFRYVYNLKKVEMTSSVKKVGSSILPSCNFDLFYNGTLEEFNEIEYSKTEDSFLLNAHNIYTKNSLNEYEELKEREIFINSTNFGNCSQKYKITSVIISKDLTSIDYEAFSGWSSLESIEIPNSVTSIGGYAFENCSSLKNIVIPNSVTSIGDHAFENCSNLKNIVIPNSVTSIGSAAFIGCDSLKSITLPFVGETINGTTNTNFEYIFGVNEPSSLKEVIINGPCIIRSNAFEYLNVKTIKFMSEVKEIESGALFRISNRTNIYLSKDIEIINDYIFETSMMGEYYGLIIYSDALEKPSTWGELWRYDYPEYYGECTIYYNADENTHYEKDGKHYFLNLDTKEATLTTYLGDSEIVEIDETIIVNDIEFTVTKIGDFAFAACENIKKIILNGSLNTIGNKAFVSCTNLTDLYIGKNVINVGAAIISSENTLVLCEAESKPEGWDENWNNFEANWSCNENNIYESDDFIYRIDTTTNEAIILKYKGESPFVTINQTATINDIEYKIVRISSYAFSYINSNARVVRINNDNIPIDNNALCVHTLIVKNDKNQENWDSNIGCTNIWYNVTDENFYNENGIIYICDQTNKTATVVGYSSDIVNLIIPDYIVFNDESYDVVRIAYKAFYENNTLETISIGNRLLYVDDYAFEYCKSVNYIDFGTSIKEIGNSAFYGVYLSIIELPNSVTSIGDYAFSLKERGIIFIPNSVEIIGYCALNLTVHSEGIFYLYCEATSKPSGWDNEWLNSYMQSYEIHWNQKMIEFYFEDGFVYSLDDENKEATIYEYVGNSEEIIVKSQFVLNGTTYNIVKVKENAFYKLDFIKKIIIPETLKYMEYRAFNCKNADYYLETSSIPSEWDYGWHSFSYNSIKYNYIFE